MLNTPYNYYSYTLGEDSFFAKNLWLLVALVKLVITYIFLKRIQVGTPAVLIVIITASVARVALSLPFPVIVIGYVMYFTDWLTIPLKDLKIKNQPT